MKSSKGNYKISFKGFQEKDFLPITAGLFMNHQILYLSLLFLVLFLNRFLSAQESINQNVQYELISEKKIAPMVTSWFFSASQQRALTPDQMLSLADSRVDVFPHPPRFLKTSFSKNGRFFAIQTLNPRETVEKVDRELTISIYSDLKKESYRLVRTVYYDHSFPSLTISGSDGSMVLGENDSGELWFYDENGELIRQVMLFPEAEYDLEKVLDLDMSEDGSRIAVVAGKRGGSPIGSNAINPSAEPHLFFFTGDGQELWRKLLPDYNSTEVAISSNGQVIVANSFTISVEGKLNKRTLVFRQNGDIITEADMLFKQARFSEDTEYLLLASNQELQMVDLIAGKVMWSQKVLRKEGMIVDLDIADGGKQVAVLLAINEWNGSQFVYRQPLITIYDDRGEKIQKLTFADESSSKPAIHFINQDKNLLVGLGNTLYQYQKN
jgi:hypothetical protein